MKIFSILTLLILLIATSTCGLSAEQRPQSPVSVNQTTESLEIPTSTYLTYALLSVVTVVLLTDKRGAETITDCITSAVVSKIFVWIFESALSPITQLGTSQRKILKVHQENIAYQDHITQNREQILTKYINCMETTPAQCAKFKEALEILGQRT